ncbi:MFS transporter [Sulfodiicoccus acidiphilus]|nr:MFS transporter [Sulfodiicoccus acidiphilus]
MKWAYIVLGWVLIFPELFVRLAYGITLKPFLDSIGGTYLVGGAVLAGFYVGYMGGNIPLSILVDRNGYKILFLEMLGTAVGALLFAEGRNALTAASGMFVMGLCSAATYTASMKLVVENSDSYKSVSIGLLESAGPSVLLLSGALLPRVISTAPWQDVYLSVAAICGAVAVPFYFLKAERRGPESSARSLLLSRRIWGLSVVRFFGLWGVWGISTWLFTLLRLVYGFSATQSGLYVTLFGAVGILSIPVAGLMADLTRSRRKVTLILLTAFFVTAFLFPLTPRAEVWVTTSILGFLAFAYRSPLDTIIAEYRRGLTATSMGVANTVSQASQVVVPILVGSVLTFSNMYWTVFPIVALGPGLATLILWRLK